MSADVFRVGLARNNILIAEILKFENSIHTLKAIQHGPTSSQCIFIVLTIHWWNWFVRHFRPIRPLDLDLIAYANRGLLGCFVVEATEHDCCFANPFANSILIGL